MARITVVIPVFRRPELLHRALIAVASQTYSDFEIIVIDDGSGARLAEQLAASHPYVKVITSPRNEGASAARNRGILAASGELIAFLDHDDVWDREYLARQVAAIESDPHHVLSVTDIRHTPLESEPVIVRAALDDRFRCALEHLLFRDLIITMSQAVVRRSALDTNRLLDPRLRIAHDLELYLRLLRNGTFVRVPEVLVEKLDQPTSISRDLVRIADEDVLALEWFFADSRNKRFLRHRRNAIAERLTSLGMHIARRTGAPLVGTAMIARAATYNPFAVGREVTVRLLRAAHRRLRRW